MSSNNLTTQSNRRALCAWFVLLSCCAFYVLRGYHDERTLLRSNDFKTVYGASRCLLKGCDPYDSAQALHAYLDGGGPSGEIFPSFRAHEVIYMPSALALLTPLEFLRWRMADRIWLALSTGIFVAGCLLIAGLCFRLAPLTSAMGIGMMLIGSTKPVMLAQPEQLSSGLCAIAVWCFFARRHQWLGTICFAIALAFKPHAVGLIWLFFLLCTEYRPRALRVLVATILISLPGFVWMSVMPASSHWLHEVRANVAALSQHGMTNDPGPANPRAVDLVGLQNMLSLVRDDPRSYNSVTYAVCGLLIVAWWVALQRFPPSLERDYLGLAVIALISMLPVYHRDYDVGLLIVIFPGLAMLASRVGGLGLAASAITLLAWIPLAHDFQVVAFRFVIPRLPTLGVWETLFWLRSVSWASLLLAFVYLGCFIRMALRSSNDSKLESTLHNAKDPLQLPL